MYDNLDEDTLRQLFGFQLPDEQESFHAQAPQLTQGLLGDVSGQQQQLQDLASKGSDMAANLAQIAQSANQSARNGNSMLAGRYAQGQQALAQQQQQQAQLGSLLGNIASAFMPNGSILGYLKKI